MKLHTVHVTACMWIMSTEYDGYKDTRVMKMFFLKIQTMVKKIYFISGGTAFWQLFEWTQLQRSKNNNKWKFKEFSKLAIIYNLLAKMSTCTIIMKLMKVYVLYAMWGAHISSHVIPWCFSFLFVLVFLSVMFKNPYTFVKKSKTIILQPLNTVNITNNILKVE